MEQINDELQSMVSHDTTLFYQLTNFSVLWDVKHGNCSCYPLDVSVLQDVVAAGVSPLSYMNI